MNDRNGFPEPLPVDTAEQFAFLKELGFIPVYEPDGAVHFICRDHYAECVERGIMSGSSRQ
jgi:hypothetical protein